MLMKIAYTVCSLNRLGQVSVLARSLLKYNPDYTFFVGLADEITEGLDLNGFEFSNFIPLSKLQLPNHEQLVSQYNIFELSCALKSFFAEYLASEYTPNIIFYFDTDICVYDNFSAIEELLESNSILLTPHFLSPPPRDGKFPLERDVLNSGLYNGGFFAIKVDEESNRFVQWWKSRVAVEGYNNVAEGMMVDQLWLNLVPLYFKCVSISTHACCNMAYWNMHERELTLKNGRFFSNRERLIFFHFSGFNFQHPNRLSIHQNRFEVNDGSVIQQLLREYQNELIAGKYSEYENYPCFYSSAQVKPKVSLLKKTVINILKASGYKLEMIRKT
jgi:hypothetical protein